MFVFSVARKTAYKVYVAAVNGGGRGEWQETIDTVTTQGIGELYWSCMTHTHTHTHLRHTN